VVAINPVVILDKNGITNIGDHKLELGFDCYTRHRHKLNFSHETGGQEKDFAHPTKAHPKKV